MLARGGRRPRRRPAGHEAVLVCHQLPIWITRLHAREAVASARPAQAAVLAGSLTSLHVRRRPARHVSYTEPAGDLLPVARPQGAVLGR